jgi:hypothetical protein
MLHTPSESSSWRGPRTLLRLRSAATVAELADELDGVYCSQRVVDKAFFSENTVKIFSA